MRAYAVKRGYGVLRQTIERPELAASTIRVVALLAASLADHRQARNAQIAGLLLAECRLRFSRLQFVGYEAADSYLMPEVPVNLNGAAA